MNTNVESLLTIKVFRILGITMFLFTVLLANGLNALAMTYDFEAFNDNYNLTNDMVGLTFSNSLVFSAGISLNEYDFPPHSGQNVVTPETGSDIYIAFDDPVSYIGAFFTFSDQLTLNAYSSTNTLLASVQSIGSNVLGGWEDIHISGEGISYLSVSGVSAFTLDDLTITGAQTVPEPSTLFLLTTCGLFIAGFRLFTTIHHKDLF